MIKLFSSSVNVARNFKLQKKEKNDESLLVHLDSLDMIQSAFDEDSILGFYEITKDVDTSFLSDVFCYGIEYVNKYNIYNYRSLYNYCKMYDEYTVFKEDLPYLINNSKNKGYILVRVNRQNLGINEPFVPIYRKKDGKVYLLGQYVYGYVPLKANGRFGNMILSSNYSINYYSDNKNLLYEAIIEFKLKQKVNHKYHNDKSLEELFQMIVNAYVETANSLHKKQADYALSLLFQDKVCLFHSGHSKELLKKYVAYADLKKILSTGLNLSEDTSLDELFNVFTEKYSSSEYVKPKVKKLN